MYQTQEINDKIKKHNVKNAFARGVLMIISITLCVIFSWNAAVNFLSVVQLYLNKPSYVMNVIKATDASDYENNEVLKDEIYKTIDAVLSYAINYQFDENTKFNGGVIYNIDSEKQRTQKQIDLVKDILPYQIENNIINPDFIERGFVDLTENQNGRITFNSKKYDARMNTEKIDRYYISQCNQIIENYKLSDSNYEEIYETLSVLDGVNFAVVNRNSGAIVSNAEITEQNMLAEKFSEKEYTVIVSSDESQGSMDIFDEYVKEQAKNYGAAFDAYISFDSLSFNDVCKNAESETEQVRKDMVRSLITAVLFMVMSDILIFVFVYAEYKNRNVVHARKALTVILGAVLTVLLIAAVAIVVITLTEVLTAQELPLGVHVSSDLPFAIIKLCAAVMSVYETGILSLIVRQHRLYHRGRNA